MNFELATNSLDGIGRRVDEQLDLGAAPLEVEAGYGHQDILPKLHQIARLVRDPEDVRVEDQLAEVPIPLHDDADLIIVLDSLILIDIRENLAFVQQYLEVAIVLGLYVVVGR